MSVLSTEVMDALLDLRPNDFSFKPEDVQIYNASGCDGSCARTCSGSCGTGCSWDCGRSCSGSCEVFNSSN